MTDIQNETLPAIVLSEADHEMLNRLALASLDRSPELSDQLLGELERARIVADSEVPAGVARMGSTIRYRTDAGQEHTVTLVYPAEADIDQGRISVMTPVGTALIGLAAGQSITWRDRADKRHVLTVLEVTSPAAE